VSDPISRHHDLGACERPFSGPGIQFDPLGVKPGRTGISLHHAGWLPANSPWDVPGALNPLSWRFCYSPGAGCRVRFGQRELELTPEHLLLIPPNHSSHCLGCNAVPLFWMAFSFTGKLAPAQPLPVLLRPRDTELCLIRDLRELLAAQPSRERTEAIYRNSLALLQVVLARPELSWQRPLPENFARVREGIEGGLASKLTVPLLARWAGLSVASFNRGFKRHFGATPARYVTDRRVREAARLLSQTAETIEAIAEETGFPNRYYFSRIFRQATGEAPAGFRRRRQG